MPLCLLIGFLFSLFSQSHLSRIWNDKYFYHGLIFLSIFNFGVLAAIALYPDWMWMYFVDSKNLNLNFLDYFYIFIFLYYAPYCFGFFMGKDFKKNGQTKLIFMALAACVFFNAYLLYQLFERYAVLATYENFHQGKSISLFLPNHDLSVFMNATLVLMVLYFCP